VPLLTKVDPDTAGANSALVLAQRWSGDSTWGTLFGCVSDCLAYLTVSRTALPLAFEERMK